jgi:hypothetical protein
MATAINLMGAQTYKIRCVDSGLVGCFCWSPLHDSRQPQRTSHCVPDPMRTSEVLLAFWQGVFPARGGLFRVDPNARSAPPEDHPSRVCLSIRTAWTAILSTLRTARMTGNREKILSIPIPSFRTCSMSSTPALRELFIRQQSRSGSDRLGSTITSPCTQALLR